MRAFDAAWQLLKASRQMKLYNYIENYPGKEPVTAYRGVPFPSTKPMSPTMWDESSKSSRKKTPFNNEGIKGTYWATDGPEPHATASYFGSNFYNHPLWNGVVLGHRGSLENIGEVQRRSGEWNPANDAYMNEAFVAHNEPIDWENIVMTRPSKSVTEDMTEDEHDAWINEQKRMLSGDA